MALAQHADDQVETLLLALSRGAGVAGLAAMPAQWSRADLEWHRPLLDLPGQALRDWLAARGQAWVEDPTNADARYTRNRIRAQLLPALQQAFPQFRATFARSSRHCAEAAELLQEMAQADLAAIGTPGITALQALSPARQANVLRHWRAACMPPRPVPRSSISCSRRSAFAVREATASISRWGGVLCGAWGRCSIGTIDEFWSNFVRKPAARQNQTACARRVWADISLHAQSSRTSRLAQASSVVQRRGKQFRHPDIQWH
ncbi:Integrin beta-7 [Manis javanica]|nr:Integrin beta-7 [Manis javanica]